MVAGRFRGLLTRHLLGLTVAFATPSATTIAGLPACVDYHCDRRQIVELSAPQWDRVREEFVAVSDPAAERRAIRRAIARLETYVGVITGTAQDLAQNRLHKRPGSL